MTFPASPRSPHLLKWQASNIRLAEQSDEVFRQRVVANQRLFDNIGITDNPTGRNGAYLDACSWDERSAGTVNQRVSAASSCGMFLHNVLAFCGARHEELLKTPYPFGEVINMILNFADAHSAKFSVLGNHFKNNFSPKPGDMLYLTNSDTGSQHILMVTSITDETDKATIISIDGGQLGLNNVDQPCCGIMQRTRAILKNGGKLGRKFDSREKRSIHTWIDLSKCKPAFTEPCQEIIRNTADLPLTYSRAAPNNSQTDNPFTSDDQRTEFTEE